MIYARFSVIDQKSIPLYVVTKTSIICIRISLKSAAWFRNDENSVTADSAITRGDCRPENVYLSNVLHHCSIYVVL